MNFRILGRLSGELNLQSLAPRLPHAPRSPIDNATCLRVYYAYLQSVGVHCTGENPEKGWLSSENDW
jgi:hypothetical protein